MGAYVVVVVVVVTMLLKVHQSRWVDEIEENVYVVVLTEGWRTRNGR